MMIRASYRLFEENMAVWSHMSALCNAAGIQTTRDLAASYYDSSGVNRKNVVDL